ncbi:DUF2530 domain-containing protein [Rhodococcus sp. HNM0563]|uniref:DUF2530 domain-containing protein n=1 Tax=unclassified Rhodococcus (in: high G+C Gram-positive bacteria) TaxID=192944 RepID=UPI00146DF814|nr:DUF2530 domain-containing protein [Rhodococcus sp. F64268]MCK0089451.1 DUF2530 domain-containing protein [Rhodococcus sp. F64268]NLU62980.1 DUF2530 domain-containing protein [Rhodococcus sp. HNM0563]
MRDSEIIAGRIRAIADPRPALAIGTGLWVVVTLAVLIIGERWSAALPVCIAGIIVGLLGTGLFLVQRSASRRGRRGAQVGLE